MRGRFRAQSTCIELRQAAPHNCAKRIDQRTEAAIANHGKIEIDSSIEHIVRKRHAGDVLIFTFQSQRVYRQPSKKNLIEQNLYVYGQQINSNAANPQHQSTALVKQHIGLRLLHFLPRGRLDHRIGKIVPLPTAVAVWPAPLAHIRNVMTAAHSARLHDDCI